MKVIVSNEIEQVCPEFVGACVEAQVVNSPYCEELWEEIKAMGKQFCKELTTESLKEMTRVAPGFTFREKLPSMSVTVPLVVPFSITVAPINGP